MAKRLNAVGTMRASRSKKTKKRLEIKKAMLAGKAASRSGSRQAKKGKK